MSHKKSFDRERAVFIAHEFAVHAFLRPDHHPHFLSPRPALSPTAGATRLGDRHRFGRYRDEIRRRRRRTGWNFCFKLAAGFLKDHQTTTNSPKKTLPVFSDSESESLTRASGRRECPSVRPSASTQPGTLTDWSQGSEFLLQQFSSRAVPLLTLLTDCEFGS